MKLQDKETLNIANAVKNVLEKKVVKEIKYPHKMYSPEGEEVTASNKEEHEAYIAKGYTHDKPEKEVEEGRVVRLEEPEEIQTEAEKEPNDEETENQKKYQAFFQKALKKFGVKSIAELDDAKKKEFFAYVDKNYDAKTTNTSKDFKGNEQTESDNSVISEGDAVWGASFRSPKPDSSFPKGNVLNLEYDPPGDMKGDIFTIRIKMKSHDSANHWIGEFLNQDPLDASKNWRELQLGGPIEKGSDGVWGSDKKGPYVILMGTKRMLQKVLKGERGIKRSDYPGIL